MSAPFGGCSCTLGREVCDCTAAREMPTPYDVESANPLLTCGLVALVVVVTIVLSVVLPGLGS